MIGVAAPRDDDSGGTGDLRSGQRRGRETRAEHRNRGERRTPAPSVMRADTMTDSWIAGQFGGRALAVALVFFTARAVACGQEQPPADFYCDFRKPPLPPEVELYNDHDDVSCRFEPEGLRIAIPKTARH